MEKHVHTYIAVYICHDTGGRCSRSEVHTAPGHPKKGAALLGEAKQLSVSSGTFSRR